MKLNFRVAFISFLLCIAIKGFSQNCDCIIAEVENNTVSPCDYTIGNIVTVTTATEFRNAVNEANTTGGNMTILIADGIYEIASTLWYPYITASDVVFKSLSGNRDAVVLTGSGMDAVNGTEIGIYAVGNNITISDLTIRDLGNHGIAVTGDNLFVYNVKIQDTFEQMIKGNSTSDGIHNGKVRCSLFEYTNGIGPQWYIGGLDIHGGINWTVSDNVFYDISSPSVALAEHAIHFWDGSVDNLIERNKIVNCDRGIGFGLGNSTNDGGVIKNNIIMNDGSNIYNDVGIGLESSPNTKVYNNSIYIDYPNAIEYRFTSTTNVDITNNLTNKLITSRNGGTATVSTNNTNAIPSWFMNTDTGDLRLTSNESSVVDQGTFLPSVTMDLDKTDRPQGSQHDIGAKEYKLPSQSKDINGSTSDLSMFPNPTSNKFTIKSKAGIIDGVTIYNSMNQKIASFKNENSATTLDIDVSGWPVGVYVCLIARSNAQHHLERIVISR